MDGAVKALEMRNICKSFGGVHALVGVDYTAYKGKVNVLMGENGAGKSTLMKVLAGAITKDSGEIIFEGQPLDIKGPKEAIIKGVSMIYQELNLVPQMSVEANMTLGKEKVLKGGFVRRKKMETDAQAILDQYGINIKATDIVSSLSIAQQQMVEIAKALASNAKLIVMDEPTSSLTTAETENLFRIIKNLNENGVTIIYISHRMEEIFRIGHYVTVMRDGHYIGNWPVQEMNRDKLIAAMVGREITNLYPKEDVEIGELVMSVRNFCKQGKYQNISFDLHKGEILGMSGLIGAGRTEVAMGIFGAMPPDQGQLFLKGQEVHINSPRDAMKHKIAYIPEDRKNLALDLKARISNNITLGNIERLSSQFGWMKRAEEIELSEKMCEKLRVKTPSIFSDAGSLSGGNQQKVVLAKWLARDLDVLILDEPTRGIDVGSKEEIHKLIVELAKQGLAIIFISSELPEVLGMSDRIVVMYEGNLKAIVNAKDVDQEKIMAYSIGSQIS